MKFNIITMYPSIFDGFCNNPIVHRAVENGLVSFNIIDIKKYTPGCYRKLDDSPYGGNKGMILRVDAVDNALNGIGGHKILLSPKGTIYNQNKAVELSSYSELTFICGHYEGYDARIESLCDEMISIGDFILSGGENACSVICDSIVRLIPGVLKDGVTSEESFSSGLLEYNQYTHPAEYKGMSVPSVLMSGNKAEIDRFNKCSALMETAKHRPDLLQFSLTVGRSSSDFVFLDDLVLKVDEPINGKREFLSLSWLQGRLNVPVVYDYYSSSKSYLLMSKVPGKMLYEYDAPFVIKKVVEALKTLWSIDISSCPYDMGPDNKLALIHSDSEDYKWLCSHKPPMDPVFSHGDLCLPNIVIGKKGKISFIDLGLAGVCDRYCDIALCLRSIKYNFPDFELDYDRFFSYLGLEPDYDKLKWYTLLDELY